MKEETTIKILFDEARNSELEGFEYIIPEGFEAEIKDGKVIVRKVEKEDEKIRKSIIKGLSSCGTKYWGGFEIAKAIAWLEKQGKQKNAEEIISNPDYISPKDKALFKIANVLSQHEDKNDSPLEEIRSILVDYGINNLESNEQKPLIIPKFRKGDRIIEKSFDECNSGTIKDIKDGRYIFDDGSFINIEEQNFWQLVEQKPTDNIEPKFKVGDWIVHNNSGCICQVNEIEDDKYCLWLLDSETLWYLRIVDIDDDYHLWTIQDAKDGDVLAFKNNISGTIICKSPTNYETRSYCRLVWGNPVTKEENGWDCTLLVPATKEQRDILFQKMKEAGYEWDEDEKELKKIEQKSLDSSFEIKPKFKFGDIIREKKTGNLFLVNSIEDFGYTLHYKNCNANGCTMSFKYEDDYELVEQDPVGWSRLNSCISILKTSDGYGTLNSEWLKSLKYRVQPQLKQEWSYEDENRLSSLLFLLHEYNNYNFDDWLKLLKNRVQPK